MSKYGEITVDGEVYVPLRTCTMEYEPADWHDEGVPPDWVCSACGSWTSNWDRPNYCMDCGAKVVAGDE